MNFKNMDFLMLFVAFLIGYLFNYIIKRCSVIEGNSHAKKLMCDDRVYKKDEQSDAEWAHWLHDCCGMEKEKKKEWDGRDWYHTCRSARRI